MGVRTRTSTEHRYQLCRDEYCERYVCRVYREACRDGLDEGRRRGFDEGSPPGYAEGLGVGSRRPAGGICRELAALAAVPAALTWTSRGRSCSSLAVLAVWLLSLLVRPVRPVLAVPREACPHRHGRAEGPQVLGVQGHRAQAADRVAPGAPDPPHGGRGLAGPEGRSVMKGTWETTGGGAGQLVPVLGALAAIGAIVWLVVTFIWVIAAAVAVVLGLVVAVLVWLARHGAEVATVQRSALPPPEATPLTSRASQALPAPQLHVHYHLHLDGQAAEVVRRQAITERRTS